MDVNLTSEGRSKLQLGNSIEFTYEVSWKKSNVKFQVNWWFKKVNGIWMLLLSFTSMSEVAGPTAKFNILKIFLLRKTNHVYRKPRFN